MSRIGTESAFEVLVKARPSKQQGKNIVHLEIGQPDFPTPRHVVEAGKRALDEGWTGYGPTAGFPEFRELIARLRLADARHHGERGQRLRRPRREAHHVLHDDGGARAWRRSDLSESRLSDLRVGDRVPGSDGGSDAARREPRFLLRSRRVRGEALQPDEDGGAQFAGQSDWRRDRSSRTWRASPICCAIATC